MIREGAFEIDEDVDEVRQLSVFTKKPFLNPWIEGDELLQALADVGPFDFDFVMVVGQMKQKVLAVDLYFQTVISRY